MTKDMSYVQPVRSIFTTSTSTTTTMNHTKKRNRRKCGTSSSQLSSFNLHFFFLLFCLKLYFLPHEKHGQQQQQQQQHGNCFMVMGFEMSLSSQPKRHLSQLSSLSSYKAAIHIHPETSLKMSATTTPTTTDTSSTMTESKNDKDNNRRIDEQQQQQQPIILNTYNPLEQVVTHNTKKMKWLLRTTSQIIILHTDEEDVCEDEDKDEAKSYHPIGTLPSTLITKIPTLMNLWMKRCGSIDNSNAAFVVERLFQRLIDEYHAGNDYFIEPNSIDATIETDATAFKNDTTNTRISNVKTKAEQMISTDLYNIVIEAWTRTSGQEVYHPQLQSKSKVNKDSHSNKHVVDNSDDNSNDNNTKFFGDNYFDKDNIHKYQKYNFAAMRAHDILNKMEDLAYNSPNDDDGASISSSSSSGINSNVNINMNARPDTKTYSLVLKAWVRAREHCSLKRMEEILDRLEEVGSSTSSSTSTTTTTIGTTTTSTTNDDNKDDNYYSYQNVQPTVQCFNIYLYALANSNHHAKKISIQNAKKANDILDDLKKRYNDDPIKHGNLLPDVNTYNQVLSAYARTRTMKGASQAQNILDDMMKEANVTNVFPDTDTFNAVMGCWHKSGSKQASFHIEYLLNLMNGLSDSSVAGYHNACPDRYSVNTAIAAIGKSGRKEKLRRSHYILANMEELYEVKPDSLSYNLVIDAYAKSHDARAVKETQRLLTTMEELYINGNDLVMPDSCTYSAVIDTVRSRMKNGAGRKAEGIVRRMENISRDHDGKKPSTAVYNAVINCYATSGEKRDIHRLEAILRFMEGMSKIGETQMRPNIITYNTVLKGYSQSKENLTKKAELLLERMESHNLQIRPDVISYTTVITTFARSSMPGKARNAKRILDRMIDSYGDGKNIAVKPTIYPFNACLNACAFTFNRAEKINAFIVVVDTLALTQKYTRLDSTTYGTIMKAWQNLIPKDDERRQEVLSSSFRQCCKEGQVGQMVMRQLQLAATPEVYRELVGRDIKDRVAINSLPSKWTRNVRER